MAPMRSATNIIRTMELICTAVSVVALAIAAESSETTPSSSLPLAVGGLR